MHPRLQDIFAHAGFALQRDHRSLASALARGKASGELVSPLPGVFLPQGESSQSVWLRAVSAWAAPSGVIHGRSAAALWLPEVGQKVVSLAHPTLRSRPGIVITKRPIPREFITNTAGLRRATPAFAAVELAATDEGRALSEALRQRLVRPGELTAALNAFAGTSRQGARRGVVQAALRNPWSYAELRLHQILTAAGINDWVANQPLRCGDSNVFPDMRFLAVKLVVEFDGRGVHEQQFLADRERQNLLVAAGYRTLRFGWEHLDQPDYIVATVKLALRAT